jgi:hypothetical protein
MFIASVRFSALKVAAVLLALGVIIAAAFWTKSRVVVQVDATAKYSGITTNEKRVQFLGSYGWKVDENPMEVVELTIPQTFSAVYKNYNALQKKQGFDLSRYAGKRVKRWTYKVTNYPGVTDEVHANLLIYNDVVIGGDISTVALDGFMQGFAQNTTVSQATPQNANISTDIFSPPAAN